jgi:hypothetical protein
MKILADAVPGVVGERAPHGGAVADIGFGLFTTLRHEAAMP